MAAQVRVFSLEVTKYSHRCHGNTYEYIGVAPSAQVGVFSLEVTRYSYRSQGTPMAIPIAIPQSQVSQTHAWGPRNTEAALCYTWASIPMAAQVVVWLSGHSYGPFLYSCLGSAPVLYIYNWKVNAVL